MSLKPEDMLFWSFCLLTGIQCVAGYGNPMCGPFESLTFETLISKFDPVPDVFHLHSTLILLALGVKLLRYKQKI
jgi:hypothetical protein